MSQQHFDAHGGRIVCKQQGDVIYTLCVGLRPRPLSNHDCPTPSPTVSLCASVRLSARMGVAEAKRTYAHEEEEDAEHVEHRQERQREACDDLRDAAAGGEEMFVSVFLVFSFAISPPSFLS